MKFRVCIPIVILLSNIGYGTAFKPALKDTHDAETKAARTTIISYRKSQMTEQQILAELNSSI